MINQRMLDLFCYWIRERERIRIVRKAGAPKPWTKDEILATYHFCNVRREDDRGTRELREVWRSNVSVCPLEHYQPAIWTAARLFNDKESFDAVLTFWRDPMAWVRVLKNRRLNGETVFNTAYVVSTCGKSMDKIDYVLEVVKDVIQTYVPRTTCREAYEALLSVGGLGSFLAGQVVADLKNIGYISQAAADWNSFSVPGPGSLKGLGFIFGKSSPRLYDSQMNELETSLPADIRAMSIHRQDLQNCLCEFSKYVRYLDNLPGRRRPYYG